MLTGRVTDIGVVENVIPNREGKSLHIRSKLAGDIGIDDSVSVNGACQTAIEAGSNSFAVQTIHTSLQKTTLGHLRPGDEVNLELALRLSDRLEGPWFKVT